MSVENTKRTLAQFIIDNQIQFFHRKVKSNPQMSDMPAGSSHWSVAIRANDEELQTWFSMGPAHKKPPTLAEVLDCLASDASGYKNARSFEDWCSEYGYESDSIKEMAKARKTYDLCGRCLADLVRVLGENETESLMFEIERL